MSLEIEKYTINNSIDNKISLLNNTKQMVEAAKNKEDLEKAISYAEYVLTGLSNELSACKKKIK